MTETNKKTQAAAGVASFTEQAGAVAAPTCSSGPAVAVPSGMAAAFLTPLAPARPPAEHRRGPLRAAGEGFSTAFGGGAPLWSSEASSPGSAVFSSGAW